MRAVKIRAVNEGRRLKDVMADVIRRGLSQEPGLAGTPGTKVRLPLVACAHPARPEEEIRPSGWLKSSCRMKHGQSKKTGEPVR